MYKRALLAILGLCFLVLISACSKDSASTDDSVSYNATEISPNMTYIGTKYINCHLSSDFPASAENEESLSGTLEKPLVSRKDPLLNAVVIDDQVLYSAVTRSEFSAYGDFSSAIGKKLTVQGYYGEKVGEYTIFYITDVPGWRYVCCDATLADTGKVSSPNVCFWLEK